MHLDNSDTLSEISATKRRNLLKEDGGACRTDSRMTTLDLRDTNLTTADEWRELAPMIHRQRLVVEGVPAGPISDADIRDYLTQLAVVTDMVTLIEPVTHRSPTYGWAGWTHWETSGSHFYAWDEPMLFFSVDIYTCKPFDPDTVVAFTAEYFDAVEITAKSF